MKKSKLKRIMGTLVRYASVFIYDLHNGYDTNKSEKLLTTVIDTIESVENIIIRYNYDTTLDYPYDFEVAIYNKNRLIKKIPLFGRDK